MFKKLFIGSLLVSHAVSASGRKLHQDTHEIIEKNSPATFENVDEHFEIVEELVRPDDEDEVVEPMRPDDEEPVRPDDEEPVRPDDEVVKPVRPDDEVVKPVRPDDEGRSKNDTEIISLAGDCFTECKARFITDSKRLMNKSKDEPLIPHEDVIKLVDGEVINYKDQDIRLLEGEIVKVGSWDNMNISDSNMDAILTVTEDRCNEFCVSNDDTCVKRCDNNEDCMAKCAHEKVDAYYGFEQESSSNMISIGLISMVIALN